ncbi:glycosyltransferase [Nocardioides sp. NPDC047086]|uniref:glycosyltransferase n=1 Tax=Nocardioides sp. NPDC047086 TaxID=3154810 RepID=UPI00340812E4
MRILIWHVHGSWTTAFVHGRHDYLVPVTPDRGPDGLGRARTWDWPAAAREVSSEALAEEEVDLVVLQRPHEVELAEQWLGGRRPGRDLPAVYLEHNTPAGAVPDARHPMAGRGVPIVHVTGFNDLLWDCDGTPTTVIEHGIVDPGRRYTGDIERPGMVVNDPVRRGRAVGADLIPVLAEGVGADVFGMRVEHLPAHRGLRTYENLTQLDLHDHLPRRRVYVHLNRWTSLGLSLIEAMHLGMPVVALATTETPLAVPHEAGFVTTRRDEIVPAVRHLMKDPDVAEEAGLIGRRHARRRYGLERFLDEWDDVFRWVATGSAA